MSRDFSLFQTPLDFVKPYWKEVLSQGGSAIDATCGNGKDALFLYPLIKEFQDSHLYVFDIQEQAILKAKENFAREIPLFSFKKITFFHESHEDLPKFIQTDSIKLIVYNLGFLPGGDKQKTTLVESTLKSIKSAETLLAKGGLISITCYPGHPEGEKEALALEDYLQSFSNSLWCVSSHRFINRRKAPFVFFLQKNQSK